MDANVNKIRICAQSKRWWNCEINDRRSTLGREKWKGRRSEAAAHAKAELQRLIWQSKSRMWNDYMPKRRGAEV